MSPWSHFSFGPPWTEIHPKMCSLKANFAFGVRFSPFFASQYRGGLLRKILKVIWKPNKVYTLLGISFLIHWPTIIPPTPKRAKILLWKRKFAFRVRFSPFFASQHRGGQLGKLLKVILKPNKVYTLLGISFLIHWPTIRPPHPKKGKNLTPKVKFTFWVRFLPFFASQNRGGQLGKILKVIWKPNKVYTLLGISFLIQRLTVMPTPKCVTHAFGVRFSPFSASQHREGQLGKNLKVSW